MTLVSTSSTSVHRWLRWSFCDRLETEVTVRGLHYIQEDSPAQIAAAVASFAERVC